MPTTQVATPEPTGSVRPPQSLPSGGDAARSAQVVATGELDIDSVPRLDSALRRAEAEATVIVLDLRELEFMDCSGVHLLIAADRRIRRAGGRLVVVRGPAEVQWLLEVLGVDGRLELVDRPPASAGDPLSPGGRLA